MMRKLSTVFIGCCFLVISALHADALVPVIDEANLMQNILTAVRTLQSNINEATQIANQLASLRNEALNLMKMDPFAANQNVWAIQQQLFNLQNMTYTVRGLVMDYNRIQNQFDSLYPAFSKYNGMSGADYANQVDQLHKQTQNSMFDAMKAQGIVADTWKDQMSLQSLINASQTANGALSAAQTGNQIAALQATEMMKMQQIMATSYRAETSYYAEVAAREAAAKADSQTYFKLDVPNTLQGSGRGPGIRQFQ